MFPSKDDDGTPAHTGRRTPSQLEMMSASTPSTVVQSGMFTSGTFGPRSDAVSSPNILIDTNAASIAAANVAASMTRSLSNISSRVSADVAAHDATLTSHNWPKSVKSPLLSRSVVDDPNNTTFVSSQGLCISYSNASCPTNTEHVNSPVPTNDPVTSPTHNVVHMTSVSSPVHPRHGSFDNDAAAIVDAEAIPAAMGIAIDGSNASIANDKTNTNPNKERVQHFLRRQCGQRDGSVSSLLDSQSRTLSGWPNSCQSVPSSQSSSTYNPRASFTSYWQRGSKQSTREDTGDSFKLSLRQFLSLSGPGFLIAMGYLNPGHWTITMAAASSVGYALIPVLLMANLCACLFQSMTIRLGLVTGQDLAEMCRREFPKWIHWPIYVMNELGILALALTEVLSSAIALELLTGLPLPIAVGITSLGAFALSLAYQPDKNRWSIRVACYLAAVMLFAVVICLSIILSRAHPKLNEIMLESLPDGTLIQTNQGRFFIIMALVGATVMPHNLFLHSHLAKMQSIELDFSSNEVKTNSIGIVHYHNLPSCDGRKQPLALENDAPQGKPMSIRRVACYSIISTTLALFIALLCNLFVTTIAGTTFYGQHEGVVHQAAGERVNPIERTKNTDLYNVYQLMSVQLSGNAAVLFAIVLLIVSQCGVITTAITGEIVFDGFIRWRCSPAIRRLVTRACTLLPAISIAAIVGREGATQLLLASHVILGIQLPFAVLPLIWLTGKARVMRLVTRNVMQHNSTNVSPTVIVSSPEATYQPYADEAPCLPQFHKSIVDGSGNFYGQQSIAVKNRVPLLQAITKEILFDQEEEMQQLNLDNDLDTSKVSSAMESAARQSSQITRPYDTSMGSQNEGSTSILRRNSILNTVGTNRRSHYKRCSHNHNNNNNGIEIGYKLSNHHNGSKYDDSEIPVKEIYANALWQQIIGWMIGLIISAISITIIIT
ncbi:natural resistance-associated macrophage protein-domain-containing protein [Syncephalis plumigaleata]|nr:natural resistance-associated macrophage protein-domain-containing protein [Syncephalis plumigaleata]